MSTTDDPPRSRRPTGAPPWRPSKLTPEVSEVILDAVAAGNYAETAAACAGVNAGTVRSWASEGRRLAWRMERRGLTRGDLTAQERRLVDFSAGLARARAVSESRDVERIGEAGRGPTTTTRTKVRNVEGEETTETTTEHAPGDWRATAWRLERRHGDHWAGRTEVTGRGGGPVEIEVIEKLLSTWRAARIAEGLPVDPADEQADEEAAAVEAWKE